MYARFHQNGSSLTKLRVLLVDDECGMPSAIRRMLSESEFRAFEFSCVSTLIEATNNFQANVHDVCIIDSIERGFADYLEQAKGVGSQIPMIVVTSANSEEILRAFHSGAQDCRLRDQVTAHQLEESICKVALEHRLAKGRLENEQRYLSLLQHTDDIIYTHDLNGNYTSANSAAERLTGYSVEEILTLNVRQVVAPEFIYLSKDMIDRKLDQQKTTSCQLEIIAKNGARIAVSVKTHLIYSAGKPIGVQGIARRNGSTIRDE
jgi:PAS domain S-box-containing protein